MAKTIQTKRCSKCKQIKTISDFHKHKQRGLQYYCKLCAALVIRKYRKTEKGKAGQKRKNQSKAGKEAYKRYRIRHPERRKAKDAVHHAITAGKLPRPNTRLCHYCPKPAQQYHHPSYAQGHQLDVVPVCRMCHISIHQQKT